MHDAAAQDAALRRALMAVRPEYFSWPLEAQECYGVRWPKDDALRIRQAVLRTLFHIEAGTEEQLTAAWDALTEAQRLEFTSTLLPLRGIGEDSFVLDEHVVAEASILDFERVYDYDVAEYRFQETARKKLNPDYKGKPYRGSLDAMCAWLRIDGALHSATLWMAAGYVLAETEARANETIETLIPFRFVDGKDHGKKKGQGRIWDRLVKAGGMKGQLEELQMRVASYLSERYDRLLDRFSEQAAGRVYLINGAHEVAPHIDTIFSDPTALQRVRFRHFMKNCRAIAWDRREVDAIVEQETKATVDFVHQGYEDIRQHFDPKVVPLCKKPTIIDYS